MTRKTRLILFSSLVFLYLVIAPVLIFYSLGYRVDFEKKRLVSTGGLYLKIWPQEANILIDDKINKRTGLFSNQILIQGLFPKKHTILVKKEGYSSWQKSLEIKDKEVTKVENITLIKEKVVFEKLKENVSGFSFSPDNRKILLVEPTKDKTQFEVLDVTTKEQNGLFTLPEEISLSNLDIIWSQDSKKILIEQSNQKTAFEYFIFDYEKTGPEAIQTIEINDENITNVSFNPLDSQEIFFLKNNTLYLKDKNITPVLNNLISYYISKNEIIWLKESGLVYKSDLTGEKNNILSEIPFPIKKNNLYKIFAQSNLVFLKEKDNLFLLDSKTGSFEGFYNPVNDFKVSPDGSKIVYFNNHEIFYSNLVLPSEKTFLHRFSEKINDCFWLNNNYLIFNVSGQIKISEIDTRDKINTVELTQPILLTDNSFLELKNPKIFWDETNKKLYILDQYNLFVSEQITDKSNR